MEIITGKWYTFWKMHRIFQLVSLRKAWSAVIYFFIFYPLIRCVPGRLSLCFISCFADEKQVLFVIRFAVLTPKM